MVSWRGVQEAAQTALAPPAVHVPVPELPLALAAHPHTQDLLLGSGRGASVLLLSQMCTAM